MYRGFYFFPGYMVLMFVSCAVTGQPGNVNKIPKDDFSKAFLYVYKEVPFYFKGIRGKQHHAGNAVSYACRKSIPGSRTSTIKGDENATAVFDFGNFESRGEAEAAMMGLSAKVATALQQKVIVRYRDSAKDATVLKRTAIAAIEENGFYEYNIFIDIVRMAPPSPAYILRLALIGGEGIFYHIIHRGEPMRSPFFRESFAKLKIQFAEAKVYHCTEQLPGFTCKPADSAGKPQVMMVKYVTDLPDARMEMGCLISCIRSMMGENFVYYFLPPANELLDKVVFIYYPDHDVDDRRSISASLEKDPEHGYVMKVMLYHP